MMSATVEFFVLEEVNEVDQEFLTNGATKATRMPMPMRTRPRGRHVDVVRGDQTQTLQSNQIKSNLLRPVVYILIYKTIL